MKIKHKGAIIAILALAACGIFIWTAYSLFDLRFSKSNVHENYSTLRADPLGCKALYESFQKISGFTVCRHLRPADEIEKPEESTLIIAGAMSDYYIISNKELFDFVLNGGRLVVLFSPNATASYFTKDKEKKEKKEDKKKPAKEKPQKTQKSDEKTKEKKKEEKKKEAALLEEEVKKMKRLKKRWGFELEKDRRSFVIETKISPMEKSRKEYGFSEMPFYSPLNIKLLHEDWTIHYSYRGKVAVAEKYYGKGSALLSTACYFASNESLRKKPQLNLLRHAFLNRKSIYFYEAHHGLKEQRNIIWLGKKYKLALLALNLILLAAFYVWKNLLSISGSVQHSEKEGKIHADFNYASGLVNLLKRGVSRKGLASSCVGEWEKTIKYRHVLQYDRDKIREMAEVSDTPRDQVDIYNKIHKTISKTKARGK